MNRLTIRTPITRWAVVLLAALVVLGMAACGGDDNGTATDEGAAPESTPTPTETEALPSPTEETTEGTGGDVDALVAELESCLEDGGIETKTEIPDLATYDEEAVIDLTFEYDALTVPGAVTIYVFASEDAAAKAKKEIDKNLLEGDSKTLLSGQVVVDDFGTTLQEPQAAEQAEVVQSCIA